MKKVFEAPVLEIVYLESRDDIVTASCTSWETPDFEFDVKENF
jgi:hypothetical protein